MLELRVLRSGGNPRQASARPQLWRSRCSTAYSLVGAAYPHIQYIRLCITERYTRSFPSLPCVLLPYSLTKPAQRVDRSLVICKFRRRLNYFEYRIQQTWAQIDNRRLTLFPSITHYYQRPSDLEPLDLFFYIHKPNQLRCLRLTIKILRVGIPKVCYLRLGFNFDTY